MSRATIVFHPVLLVDERKNGDAGRLGDAGAVMWDSQILAVTELDAVNRDNFSAPWFWCRSEFAGS